LSWANCPSALPTNYVEDHSQHLLRHAPPLFRLPQDTFRFWNGSCSYALCRRLARHTSRFLGRVDTGRGDAAAGYRATATASPAGGAAAGYRATATATASPAGCRAATAASPSGCRAATAATAGCGTAAAAATADATGFLRSFRKGGRPSYSGGRRARAQA
jgi:hypothetical protein